MLTLVASTLLAVGAVQDAGDANASNQAAAPASEAAKALTGFVNELVEAESYAFTSETETESGDEGGGGRGGGFGGGEQPPTKGAWKKGLPMQLAIGEVQAYKEGEQVVYKNAEGEWEVFEFTGFGRGERGGGGERGEGGGAGGGEGRGGGERGAGERPEGGGDRGGFSSRRALFTAMAASPPHQMLKDLEGKVEGVEKKEQDGKLVFTGKLTKEGAEGLGGASRFFRGGRGGGGGPEIETTGKFAIELAAGAISTIRFEVTRSGSFGERSFERTTIQTIAIEKVGATELEVPAEALAKFEI